jgi:hypothetical protein
MMGPLVVGAVTPSGARSHPDRVSPRGTGSVNVGTSILDLPTVDPKEASNDRDRYTAR